MKNIITLVCIFLLPFLTRAQNHELLLEDFSKSPEYKRIESILSSLGEINLEDSYVYFLDDEKKQPVGHLTVTKNKSIKAIVEFLPIPEKLDNILPNNDRFAMQLIDYNAYSASDKTGTIITFDLNYDNYLSTVIEIEKSSVKSFKAYPIPNEIKIKYGNIKKINEIVVQDPTDAKKIHFCDKNSNGNVSFGECMGCMKSACNGDAECAVLCALINAGSGYTPVPRQCSLSMAAACVYIAIAY